MLERAKGHLSVHMSVTLTHCTLSSDNSRSVCSTSDLPSNRRNIHYCQELLWRFFVILLTKPIERTKIQRLLLLLLLLNVKINVALSENASRTRYTIKTRCSAIAERPRCGEGKLWQKRASNIALLYGTEYISKC